MNPVSARVRFTSTAQGVFFISQRFSGSLPAERTNCRRAPLTIFYFAVVRAAFYLLSAPIGSEGAVSRGWVILATPFAPRELGLYLQNPVVLAVAMGCDIGPHLPDGRESVALMVGHPDPAPIQDYPGREGSVPVLRQWSFPDDRGRDLPNNVFSRLIVAEDRPLVAESVCLPPPVRRVPVAGGGFRSVWVGGVEKHQGPGPKETGDRGDHRPPPPSEPAEPRVSLSGLDARDCLARPSRHVHTVLILHNFHISSSPRFCRGIGKNPPGFLRIRARHAPDLRPGMDRNPCRMRSSPCGENRAAFARLFSARRGAHNLFLVIGCKLLVA